MWQENGKLWFPFFSAFYGVIGRCIINFGGQITLSLFMERCTFQLSEYKRVHSKSYRYSISNKLFFTLFDKKKASVVSFKPYLKWVQSDEVTSVHGQQTKDEHNKQANGDEKVLEMIAKTKQIPFDPESTSLASGPDSDSDHYEEETSK
eukprot:435999_1